MRKVFFVFLFASVCAAPAFAQQDFVGARALGMGEAQRASASGAEAAILDPSAMALQKQFAVEAMYGINIESIGHQVLASIVDSTTSKLSAGLTYQYVNSSPKVGFNWAGGEVEKGNWSRSGHVATLSLAYPIGRFILGANVRYVNISSVAALPAGTSPSQLGFDSVNGVTFDTSLLLTISQHFNLAVIGYNLWDHGSRETPLSLGMAAAVIPTQVININFDAVLNFTGYKTLHADALTGLTSESARTTARMGLGTEIMLGKKVPLRFGAIYDTGNKGTYVTGGLGFVMSMFGIDLGYRAKVDNGLENMLMIGLRFYVN